MSDSFSSSAAAWRTLRARYQRGLLAWLKGADAGQRQGGLAEMQAALLTASASRGDAAFWRTVQTLLTALADGSLPADSRAHRLCGRFDRQLRLLAEGAAGVDRALISETFDFVTGAIFAKPAALPTATATTTMPPLSVPVAPATDLTPPVAAGIANPDADPDPLAETPVDWSASLSASLAAMQAAPAVNDAAAADLASVAPVLATSPAAVPATNPSPALAVPAPGADESAAAAADFSALLLPSDEIDLDPAAVAGWEAAAAVVGSTWHDRHQAGLAAFRSAVIRLGGAGLDLHLPEALRFAEALATVADRADEPEVLADPRLVAAIAASLEVLVEPGTVKRKVFPGQVAHLCGRLELALREAAVPTEGRLIVSRTLYQMFVGEAAESLGHLRDELDTLHPLSAEMANAASALADNAATIDLTAVRDLALALANALVRYHSPLNVDVPAERALVVTVLHVLEGMVDSVAAGDLPEPAPLLVAALAPTAAQLG